MPATIVPPSIQPPQRVLQTDPDFFPRNRGRQFQTSRRPAPLFVSSGGATGDFSGGVSQADLDRFPLVEGGVGGAINFIRGAARAFDPRTFVGRRMIALEAANVAGTAALTLGAKALFDPEPVGQDQVFGTRGGPTLQIGAEMPQRQVAPTPTGLPSRGVYQKEPNGFQVQWYAMVGTQLQPITRGQAECLKRDCIYRLNVFTGDFQKLKSRRINPMNVRAFFRAGRRVDAGERICRKMFSEHRKKKTGAIRRKSRKKKR